MTVEWNPNLDKAVKAAVLEEIATELRRTTCPDHRRTPSVVQSGGELQLIACCKKAAETAAMNAGLGDVKWTPASP